MGVYVRMHGICFQLEMERLGIKQMTTPSRSVDEPAAAADGDASRVGLQLVDTIQRLDGAADSAEVKSKGHGMPSMPRANTGWQGASSEEMASDGESSDESSLEPLCDGRDRTAALAWQYDDDDDDDDVSGEESCGAVVPRHPSPLLCAPWWHTIIVIVCPMVAYLCVVGVDFTPPGSYPSSPPKIEESDAMSVRSTTSGEDAYEAGDDRTEADEADRQCDILFIITI